MIHKSSPPGFSAIPEVCATLGMGRQNFYQSGLVDLLDSWQVSPNTSRLYKDTDVALLRQWLFVRQGLIALGKLSQKSPLVPQFEDWEAFVQEGEHDADCPQCEGPAVVDEWSPAGHVWCPACGIMALDKEAKNE